MKLYKRVSLLLSMGIMAIGLISFYIAAPSSGSLASAKDGVSGQSVGSSSEDVTPEPPTPTPTAAPTPTPIPNDLVTGENPKIDELVSKYLAAKLLCTEEAFADIVTDISYIDFEDMQNRTGAIIEYTDITCYVKRGFGPVDYVVYYTYWMNIATIESPAISIESLYVQVGDDGVYRVFMGDLDDETLTELAKLSQDQDVQDLISETSNRMNEAIASDENLLQFWLKIYAMDAAQADESAQTATGDAVTGTAVGE